MKRYGRAATVAPVARAEAVALAAVVYRCDTASILSLTRARPYVHARQYAMWLLRQARNASGGPRYGYPAIARAVGLTDHTTARHADRAVEARIALQKLVAA